jgi:predicted O-methyltransferase YrrM
VAEGVAVGPWSEAHVIGMRALNERLMDHPALASTITPVGDGVALAVRLP